MERSGCGPHTEAGCAAHSLWSCFGKTLVPWQKNTTVVSEGESWEGMLQIQALQKPVEQPDVLWKVFQGLQRALHQAKARLRGRHEHFISMCPTVKGSAGVLQTHRWLLAGVKQAVPKWQWLGEAVPALPLLSWQPPRWLFPVQHSAPYAAVTGVFGVYWARGRDRVVGNGKEEGVSAEME